MVALEPALLSQLFPACEASRLAVYAPHMRAALDEFGITTPARIAAWVAQVGHESRDLTRWEEGFGYTAERLRAVFPRQFSSLDLARNYAGDRVATANRVYANRNGNGSETSGDGWRYRGRGPIQLTGRLNYRAASRALGIDLEADPELALRPEHAFRIACWYWASRHLNELADRDDVVTITRRINGGLNGLEDRRARWVRAKELLGA